MSIVTIDCDYLMPRFAAAFLMKERDEGLFVENNTTHSIPRLLEAMKKEGLSAERIRYLIITHVHLDHAGGSQALMKACPNAILLAHPRAVPHLVDPSKLVASARQVYGDEEFDRLYGEVGAVPADRIRAVGDGEEIRFGSRALRFLHTRGHANHHFCVFDTGSEAIFTGDAFGLAYPDLQTHGKFIFPSTSPTDFDPTEARQSIERIVATGAKHAYLTHFGKVDDLAALAGELNRYLDFAEPIYHRMIETEEGDALADELTRRCEREVRAYLVERYRAAGGNIDRRFDELLRLDINLNAAGMVFAAQKKRKAARSPQG